MAQLTIETDIKKLLSAMLGWEPSDPLTFNEIFASALLYAETHASTKYPAGSLISLFSAETGVMVERVEQYCVDYTQLPSTLQRRYTKTLQTPLADIHAEYVKAHPRGPFAW